MTIACLLACFVFQSYGALAAPVARGDILAVASSSGFERARTLMENRDWADAVVLLRKLEPGDASPVEIAKALSRALVYSGRREEALGVLASAVPLVKGDRRTELVERLRVVSRLFMKHPTFLIYQEGLNHLIARDYSRARRTLGKALDQEPDNAEILLRAGQAMVLAKDHDSAAERLRLARKLNPYEPEIHLWLGRALFFRGEMKEAVEELHMASEALPESEIAQSWYAQSLAKAGQASAGVQLLERAVRDHPLQLFSGVTLVRLRLAAIDGRDPVVLAGLRRDLKSILDRYPEYEKEKPRFSPESLSLDLRDGTELKASIEELNTVIRERIANPRDGSLSLRSS